MQHVFNTDHAGQVTLVERKLDTFGRLPSDPVHAYDVQDETGELLATFGSLENALHWIGIMPVAGDGNAVDSYK